MKVMTSVMNQAQAPGHHQSCQDTSSGKPFIFCAKWFEIFLLNNLKPYHDGYESSSGDHEYQHNILQLSIQ